MGGLLLYTLVLAMRGCLRTFFALKLATAHATATRLIWRLWEWATSSSNPHSERSETCGHSLSRACSLTPPPFPQSSIFIATLWGSMAETSCYLLCLRARLRLLPAGLSLHLPRLQQLHILLLHRGSIAYASGLADMHRLLRCTADTHRYT